jgi:FKBP-type peptidyl-prolyl cis-trans isomerase
MKKNSLAIFLVAGFLISCISNDSVSPQAQLRIDTTAISNFLVQKNITATKVNSGIWYHIDSIAEGIYPVLSDSVKISYSAWLIPSMTKVDSSASLTALLSTVISGWQLGLPRFPTGSKGSLFIPSGLAFGVSSHGSVPPNSNLYYKIKLNNVNGTHYASDTTAIAAYIGAILDSLVLSKIKVIKDPSGIRYSYDSSGITSNVKADLSKSIEVSVTGNVLNSKSFFINASDTMMTLNKQITAWKIILPKIKEGGRVTIYVASGYGYGSVTPPFLIPTNSNLVYQIVLKRVF